MIGCSGEKEEGSRSADKELGKQLHFGSLSTSVSAQPHPTTDSASRLHTNNTVA